jgi:hypothetical protein
MSNQENRIIARGENSNHCHVVAGNATIRNEDGEILIDVHDDAGAVIKHVLETEWLNGQEVWTKEHADIKIEKGSYKYVPQLEYDPYSEVIRQVMD